MHGDVLLDHETHTRVISGDELALRLAALLLQQHSVTAGGSAMPPAVCSSREMPVVTAPRVPEAVATAHVPPVRVVFATGAAGVFDRDPSTHAGAMVFRVIGVRPRPANRGGACACCGDSPLEPAAAAPPFELVRWTARTGGGLSTSAPCPRCGARGGICGQLVRFEEPAGCGAASAAAASAEGTSTGAADVTGGMAGKLRAAISIALLVPSAAAPELRSCVRDPSRGPYACDPASAAGSDASVPAGPRVDDADSGCGSCFCQADVDPSAPVVSIVGVDAAVLSAVFDARASLADVLAAEGTHVVRLRS
jgi:hypothetical protein